MACATPHQPTGFGQGSHTLLVRATDAAGNTDATPASQTWTVDTVGPTVVITAGPAAASTSGPYVTFGYTTTEGTLQCRMDAAAFASCTSPTSYSLPEGSHTFSVRASDAVGNTTTITRTWPVDCAGQTGGTGGIYLFPMNESSGQVIDNLLSTTDGSLGNSSSIEIADPGRFSPSRFGRGLNFVASQRDIASGTASAGGTHDHTIEAWVRPSTSTAGNTIVDVDEITLGFTSTAAGVRFSYEILTATGAAVVASSGPVVAGAWYYLVATYTGTTMRLYLDGAQVGTASITYAGTPFTTTLLVMSPPGDTVQGDLDEVFFGSAAFSATDVLTRYCPL